MREPARLHAEDAAAATLAGLVDMASVNALKAAGEAALDEASDEWTVSLADVEVEGSAAVALLVAWARAARHRQITLRFIDVPPRLAAIVDLSGVAEMLGIDAA